MRRICLVLALAKTIRVFFAFIIIKITFLLLKNTDVWRLEHDLVIKFTIVHHLENAFPKVILLYLSLLIKQITRSRRYENRRNAV